MRPAEAQAVARLPVVVLPPEGVFRKLGYGSTGTWLVTIGDRYVSRDTVHALIGYGDGSYGFYAMQKGPVELAMSPRVIKIDGLTAWESNAKEKFSNCAT